MTPVTQQNIPENMNLNF